MNILTFGEIKKMAVFSIVRLRELEGAKRLDAEYYKPEYMEIMTKLTSGKFLYFKDLVREIIHPQEIKREYQENEEGYLFLLAQNVRPLMLDFSEKRFIAREKAEQLPKNLLEKGDILFVRTGTVGVVAVYTGEPDKVIASAHILIGKPNFKISPFYIGVFFNTYFGKLLIIRGTYGALQPEISPQYLKKIPIPIFSDDLINRVEDLFFKAQDLLKCSQSLYSQAETLLLEELGLKDYRPRYEKTYTANLSSTLYAHRIDAEYFQPAYEEIIRKLKKRNIELKPLKEFILSIKKGIEIGSENYRDEGKPFIRVSNLSVYGFTDRDQKYLSEELYQQLKYDYEPKKGDFLLTKDATPGIAYVVKENIEGIISSGILRLQIDENKINKEYLALCINSIVGKMQVEKDLGGSVILHWRPDQVKRLLIPILPPPIQQQIASLVQQSHEARKRAKELLEIAKRAVEIAIEQSEVKALNYIYSSYGG